MSHFGEEGNKKIFGGDAPTSSPQTSVQVYASVFIFILNSCLMMLVVSIVPIL